MTCSPSLIAPLLALEYNCVPALFFTHVKSSVNNSLNQTHGESMLHDEGQDGAQPSPWLDWTCSANHCCATEVSGLKIHTVPSSRITTSGYQRSSFAVAAAMNFWRLKRGFVDAKASAKRLHTASTLPTSQGRNRFQLRRDSHF